MNIVATPVWLTDTELNQMARTIGDACDTPGTTISREMLHNINAEIGVAQVRTKATAPRAALSRLMSCPHALIFSEDELEVLLSLDLSETVRRKLTSGF